MSPRLLGLLMALLCAAPLRAEITSLSTDSLAPGTVLAVEGVGFGIKKAKLKLIPVGGAGKTTLLKPLSVSDGLITALFKKGQLGEYTLEVTPKGGPTYTAPSTVHVRAPELLEVVPESAQPGDEVELRGRYFGDKKGKVKVGGRKAKVLSWEAGALGDGEGATDRIRVRLSKNAKKTMNGPNLIAIRNKIDEVLAELTLSMNGGGLSTYRATVDGKSWQAVSKFGLPGYNPNGIGGVSFTGFKGKFGSKKVTALNVAISGFDPTTYAGPLPVTFHGNDVVFLYSKGTGPGASFWQSSFGLPVSGAEGETPTITITDVSGGTVTGFGEALGLTGSGPAQGTTIDVLDFEFSIPQVQS